ncbi:MAG: helix-turn-helix domain-containing protein [Eubacterium sp.]|nr:helix-turn-helix domain-containing protein [Eubacterium sp.]
MNQEKIGRFISELRKEKGMTQANMADKLGITDRAISKWETGKSMPDSSIMLELCNLLSINVNELLKGERISMDRKDSVSEELLLELKKENEEKTKLLLKIEEYMNILLIFICLSQLIIGARANDIYEMSGHTDEISVTLILINCVLIVAFAFIGTWIAKQAHYYECAECGYVYRPRYITEIMAPRVGKSRKMICPKCEKKCFHKKVSYK